MSENDKPAEQPESTAAAQTTAASDSWVVPDAAGPGGYPPPPYGPPYDPARDPARPYDPAQAGYPPPYAGYPPPYPPPPGQRRTTGGWRAAAIGAAIVAVLAITLGVVTHKSGTADAAQRLPGANGAPFPNGANNGLPGGAGGPGGGVPGEQHVQGTISALGSDTITVKTSSGTTTYAVTGTTQILRSGQQATLSQLKVGDRVVVHALPTTSNGHKQAERIFAGALPGPGGDDGFGGHGDA